MNKLLICLAIVSLTCWVCFGEGSEKPADITLASEEWSNATNADGTGLFWDLIKAVYEPEGITVKTMIRSYAGSVNLVKEKRVDALVGAYKDEVEGALFPKSHFGADVVAVIFKKDKVPTFQGEQSLTGKKVGWITGYAYDEYLGVKVEKSEYNERKDAMRVLDKGRIDYFMDARADLMDAAEDGLYDPTAYAMEDVLKLNLYLAFADNEKGRALMKIFDERYPLLVENGTVKSLYDKYAKDHFYYPF